MEKKQYELPSFKVIQTETAEFLATSGDSCNSNSPCVECFAAGTKIAMADGILKNIEDVREGDMIRTFDHEAGVFSAAKVCLAYKGDRKDKALQLQFAGGNSLRIVGTHDILCEETRKYVRINADNVAEYLGKRFYNAQMKGWDTLTGYNMTEEVDFYCIYSENHLNCIADGMLTVPDDVDYLLNLYELDADLKADADKLAADIAQYGLLDVERDYPEMAQYKELMEALMCKYQKIALGKGLMTDADLEYAREYWNQNTSAA